MDRMIKRVLIPAVAVLLLLPCISRSIRSTSASTPSSSASVRSRPTISGRAALQDAVHQQRAQARSARADPGCGPPAASLTAENKNLIVDSFVKWRITDPTNGLRFLRRWQLPDGQLPAAGDRPTGAARRVRSAHGSTKVVSGERAEVNAGSCATAPEAAMNEVGIEVLDVRIKRVDLPEDVNESIFERMAAARERVARELRALGAGGR
ncbi:MAG: SPFH domain-containing protein [Arhodomonas sp.]|nr:SPFH domain-containing protein [Arhodomonas sp.]